MHHHNNFILATFLKAQQLPLSKIDVLCTYSYSHACGDNVTILELKQNAHMNNLLHACFKVAYLCVYTSMSGFKIPKRLQERKHNMRAMQLQQFKLVLVSSLHIQKPIAYHQLNPLSSPILMYVSCQKHLIGHTTCLLKLYVANFFDYNNIIIIFPQITGYADNLKIHISNYWLGFSAQCSSYINKL